MAEVLLSMSGELGACRRAAFSVLVVLFIVHLPGVEGFDQSAYTLNVLCGCRSEPARLNVYAKGYCNNAGVELKSLYSEDFQCEQCKIGKYHRVKVAENRVVVTQYQQLKTRGVRRVGFSAAPPRWVAVRVRLDFFLAGSSRIE